MSESYMDPCLCGHSFESHSDSEGCDELGCECTEYRADTSWTDDLDDQDYSDIEEEDSI